MEPKAIYGLLGRAVAARRTALKLTQQDLADRVGVSRASVANMECGRQKVLLHHIYSLVSALELKSITELVPATLPKRDIPYSPSQVAISGDAVSDSQLVGVNQLLENALGTPPTKTSL